MTTHRNPRLSSQVFGTGPIRQLPTWLTFPSSSAPPGTLTHFLRPQCGLDGLRRSDTSGFNLRLHVAMIIAVLFLER